MRLPYLRIRTNILRLTPGVASGGATHGSRHCRSCWRETFVYEYRLMYRVEPTRIVVLRVVHGRRLISNVPGSFEESPKEYIYA